jgi:hypothetical protein
MSRATWTKKDHRKKSQERTNKIKADERKKMIAKIEEMKAKHAEFEKNKVQEAEQYKEIVEVEKTDDVKTEIGDLDLTNIE